MAPPVPCVVFSDLDGTLLDHESYSWAPARPALDALARLSVPVILASSKTAAEIEDLQGKMGLRGLPALVENGAGLIGMGADPGASEYAHLRGLLGALPQVLRGPFEGFGDMDQARIMAVTGLAPQAAALAQARAFSEPGLWHGDAAGLAAFMAALAPQGITARRGGRFLTLSFGGTKADRMAQLRAWFGGAPTLALGDAPNDIEMLEAADRAVIVANPHHDPLPPLAGEAQGRITRTRAAGPEGWNQAVLAYIEELERGAGRA